MAIKTKRMSVWLSENGEAITNASKASMLDAMRMGLSELHAGVYIMFHRCHVYTDNFALAVPVEKWKSDYENQGEIADGVLLIEGGHHLVIAPTQADSLKWSSKPVSSDGKDAVQISGVVTTTDRMQAFGDWNGRANTTAIINGSTDSNVTNTESYAAGFCNKYSRANDNGAGLTAGRWWLPSLAELGMIWANFEKINYALSKIKGATLLQRDWYWSSTQYNAGNAWRLNLYYGTMYNDWKFRQGRVRPVSAFYV